MGQHAAPQVLSFHASTPPPWARAETPPRVEIAEVWAKLAAVMTAMESLERRVLGPKSEKTPPPEEELRKGESAEDAEARRLAALERRRERAARKAQLRAEAVIPSPRHRRR